MYIKDCNGHDFDREYCADCDKYEMCEEIKKFYQCDDIVKRYYTNYNNGEDEYDF